MKSNPLAGFLVVVLVACALWTAWIMYVFTYSTGKIKNLEPKFAYMENMRAMANNLATEAFFYSKQHPAMDPVLQRFGIKELTPSGALPGPAPAPAAKTPVPPVQPK